MKLTKGLVRWFSCALLAGCVAAVPAPRPPEVRYEPTPMTVVGAMLELAQVRADDVVYDLGCGDGRIVIEAARRFGARGVCVDIDPRRIAEARANARREGVEDRIRFIEENLLETNLSDATVVMLFLSLDLNSILQPKLLKELKPGARVVSHWHRMGDWEPQKTVHAQGPFRSHEIFLWTIP